MRSRVCVVAAVAAGLALLASCGGGGVDAEPGEVVDREDVLLNAGTTTLAGVRITYGSVGADGDRVEVTGVVVVPPGEPPPDGWPVLAYGHATTGGADHCAISTDAGIVGLTPSISQFALGGFVVAATDYEGLGTDGPHTYLHGPSAARSLADAVRAARSVVDGAADRWFALGHSQGGHAALWAAEVAGEYAPELSLLGAVAIAPAADVAGLTEVAPMFTALVAAGWLEAEDLDDDDVLTDEGERAVRAVEDSCSPRVPPEPLVEDTEAFAAYLAANTPGQAATSVPILVQQGLQDQLVTPAMTAGVVERLCDAGDVVEVVEYPDADHLTVVPFGLADAIAWLGDRVAGRPPASTCPTGGG